MADPYQILSVARTATEADIKKAYRKLAKELHPDRNKDNPAKAERFGKVTQAYDLLSDKDKRARFDRGEIDGDGNPASPFGYGRGGPAGAPGGNPFGQGFGQGRSANSSQFDFSGGDPGDLNDIFEGLFGGGAARRGGGGGAGGGFGGFGRQAPAKGANIAYKLQVSFTDAATLAPQRITLGDGKAIDLKLPAGVETGTQMRLAGKGAPGTGGAGDAIVTIEIGKHPHFVRDGDHIRLELPISLKEAVTGASVRVPTVGKPVMVTIPAGTTSGKTLRLKNKGFVKKGGGPGGPRGDQLVTVMIDLPRHDAAFEQFVAAWDGGGGNPRAKLGV